MGGKDIVGAATAVLGSASDETNLGQNQEVIADGGIVTMLSFRQALPC